MIIASRHKYCRSIEIYKITKFKRLPHCQNGRWGGFLRERAPALCRACAGRCQEPTEAKRRTPSSCAARWSGSRGTFCTPCRMAVRATSIAEFPAPITAARLFALEASVRLLYDMTRHDLIPPLNTGAQVIHPCTVSRFPLHGRSVLIF